MAWDTKRGGALARRAASGGLASCPAAAAAARECVRAARALGEPPGGATSRRALAAEALRCSSCARRGADLGNEALGQVVLEIGVVVEEGAHGHVLVRVRDRIVLHPPVGVVQLDALLLQVAHDRLRKRPHLQVPLLAPLERGRLDQHLVRDEEVVQALAARTLVLHEHLHVVAVPPLEGPSHHPDCGRLDRPAWRRPIEATTVGMVTGPFQRRNGYHVEVLVQHEGAGRESLHHLFVSNEVLIETAALKGREQWDLEVGPFAEAVVSYLQQQGVELDDPDWGMQDDSVPYSHEHVTVRTLFNYYPDLKDHLAESLIPEVGPAPCTRGTAQCLCCERASAGGPAWWLPKGTRCSHALSGGRGSRGAAREPAGGRPSREGSPTFCIPGHTQRPEAVGARLVGGADAAARRLRPRAGRGGQGVDRQARGGRAEISGGGTPRCPRACPRGRRGRGSRGRMRRRSRRG
eukprot:Transcript_6841.p1 GENE.Transcript_6841~~Transcript_6841.p1  ORF type:complete len:464 (+),score=31.44 Transcript_6841:619-2010(+)